MRLRSLSRRAGRLWLTAACLVLAARFHVPAPSALAAPAPAPPAAPAGKPAPRPGQGSAVSLAGPDRVMEGHKDGVHAIAWFPDSRRAASASHDKTVRIWDTATGKELAVFEGHLGPVYSVAVSPDGALVASGSDDRTIRVWEVKTGKQVGQLEGHGREIVALAFAPDGKLVSAGADGWLRLWDVAAEKQLWRQNCHVSGARTLALSRDGKVAVTGGNDTMVRAWDLQAHKMLWEQSIGKAVVEGLRLSPDSSVVYACSLAAPIQGWATVGGKPHPFPAHDVHCMYFDVSPDGKTLLMDGGNGIGFWDLTTGKHVTPFALWQDMRHCGVISPDGHAALLGGGGVMDEQAQRWAHGTDNKIRMFLLPGAGPAGAAPNPQGAANRGARPQP